ncbi:MAG: histidine ammonia-lyase [Oligoflexia bacterium]|nr:histidine ammonia-lyase [Oligoflexia bacterium]
MKPSLTLDGNSLTIDDIWAYAHGKFHTVSVSEHALKKVMAAHSYIKEIAEGSKAVYGVNTGFGLLSDIKIEKEKLHQLQVNLILSHAVGVGQELKPEIAKAALLLRTNTLIKGNSGVSPELINTLVKILNHDLVPIIPEQGSVGACGDLAPLAHMALLIIGEGNCYFKGSISSAKAALDACGIKPHHLGPKEGLALINGTQIMTAIAALTLREAELMAKSADIISAMSLEAFRGTKAAFIPYIHQARPHKQQIEVAKNILSILDESEIANSHKDCGKVQDPYSFRCIPQVHGASRKLIEDARATIEIEINAVTDNPLIFVKENHPELKENMVISGGNFHGEFIAMAMDCLCIGLSELANISDLRLQKLINPSISGLPAFLTPDAGLNSGLMIVQVASASLVSENKILSHPASVDSIPTSADKEDHVSMGTIAARKAKQILDNLRNVLAMELLGAYQGLQLLRPLKSSDLIEKVFSEIEKSVPKIESDRIFKHDIDTLSKILKEGTICTIAEKKYPEFY